MQFYLCNLCYAGVMTSYDELRQQYKPKHIKLLLIAESPPPAAGKDSSRHFYRTDRERRGDRLFTNTIQALYPNTTDLPEAEIQQAKSSWLERLQADGVYMIEALTESQVHEVTKKDRQAKIMHALPHLLERVRQLADKDTAIVLIKSNVFDVACQPLKAAGFAVLNTALVDYPGRFNQAAYRQKLSELVSKHDLQN